MDTTGILGLPLIAGEQALKHITHNQAIDMLDTLVQAGAMSRTETEPPESPAEGDRYIVAADATGDWAGHDDELARSLDGVWAFFTPVEGWLVWVADEAALVTWNGAAWQAITGSAVAPSQFGINAMADATNRLAVGADAALFTHDGDDHRLKINKAAAGDTGSVLFQTGYSGRAEFGLAGEDDFSVKVSPDGSGWTEALRIDGASGLVSLPATPGRELLTANRTYYVDGASGADANDGLSGGSGAFATISAALAATYAVDPGNYVVTIEIADGTYAENITLNGPLIGGGRLTITGNTSTPANVLIQPATGNVVVVKDGAVLDLRGVKMVANSGLSLYMTTYSKVYFRSVDFGDCSSNQISVNTSVCVCEGNYTISGGASHHIDIASTGYFQCNGKTVTLTGTPAFTRFIRASGSVVTATGNTFSGSATGQRYVVQQNGTLNTGGGGPSYFPGSSAGTAVTGGQYT